MANITQILGTDSLSSSRPVINSNFQLLNDDITDIQALLDPTNATISGISSATVQALTVNNTSSIATFTISGIDLDVDVEIAARTTMAGEIMKTGVEGSASSPTTTTSPTSLAESAYFINTNFNLPAGIQGQEITIINALNSSVTITAQVGSTLGANSVSLDGLNSTITLRYIGTVWYIVASHAATIS